MTLKVAKVFAETMRWWKGGGGERAGCDLDGAPNRGRATGRSRGNEHTMKVTHYEFYLKNKETLESDKAQVG